MTETLSGPNLERNSGVVSSESLSRGLNLVEWRGLEVLVSLSNDTERMGMFVRAIGKPM